MEKIVINVKRLKVFRKKACLNVFLTTFVIGNVRYITL